jgi:tRNA(Ile)-lysidine synthetase-like protein
MDLLKDADAIVVAVSGGIDSMVLLDQLCSLRERLHLRLSVAHVNHRRRKASDEEWDFVRSRCEEYGVPFFGKVLQPNPDGNFHQYARTERYAFFREVARQTQSNKIALAHHADDQAETVLMRLIRGSGFIGYAGMAEQTEEGGIIIIRPLLKVTKQAIIDYQTEHELPFRQDASNEEDHYTRNRFRHHIIPALAKEDPQYARKIRQFSEYVRDAYVLIERMSADFLHNSVRFSETSADVSVQEFAALDRMVAFDVVKKIVDRLSGDRLELNHRQLESTLRLAQKTKPNAQIPLGLDLWVLRRYEVLRFRSHPTTALSFSQSIPGFGTFPLPNGDTVIITQNPCVLDGISLELWYNKLDLVFPMTVRTRQNGDRIRLPGGTKKIADLMIDLKVPREEREDAVVILDANQEIVWIPGFKVGILARQGDQKIMIHYQRGK